MWKTATEDLIELRQRKELVRKRWNYAEAEILLEEKVSTVRGDGQFYYLAEVVNEVYKEVQNGFGENYQEYEVDIKTALGEITKRKARWIGKTKTGKVVVEF